MKASNIFDNVTSRDLRKCDKMSAISSEWAFADLDSLERAW